MFSIPLITLLAATFVVWRIVAYFKKQTHKEKELEKSLEDETIYVEGVGQVNFEDLGDEARGESPGVFKKDVGDNK